MVKTKTILEIVKFIEIVNYNFVLVSFRALKFLYFII